MSHRPARLQDRLHDPVPGRRIVVHAGLHKTGTTSAKACLRANSPAIWPHAALVLTDRLRDGPARAAHRFSRHGDTDDLDILGAELALVLSRLTLGPRRRLLLSDENLSGAMPGRYGVTGYDALVPLMLRLAEGLARHCPAPDLCFVLTTRASDSWLDSLWRHAVAHGRCIEDRAAFRARMAPAADLGAVVARLRAALAPIEVIEAPLEAATGPLGPAAPLIEALRLPAEALAALRPAPGAKNRGASAEAVAEMLALNRSALSDEDLLERKRTVLARAGGEDQDGGQNGGQNGG